MSEQQPKDKQAEAEAKTRAAAQEAEAKRRAAEQQHQGAGPQSAGAAPTVNLGLFGNFAPPQYKPSIAQMKAQPPVAPLHSPGAVHAEPVVVPADFERFNPKVAVNLLRAVIEPAQAAAIDAACAAKDLPRARQLLRDVLASIAARVNAAGDSGGLQRLRNANRAPDTLAAVKMYFAVAQHLDVLAKRQGASAATHTVSGSTSLASRPLSLGFSDDEQRGISRAPIAQARDDAQRGISRAPGAQVVAASQRAAAAAPAPALAADPASLAPRRSEFQPLPRFDTMPRQQPVGFAPPTVAFDGTPHPQAKGASFTEENQRLQAEQTARATRAHELLDLVKAWDVTLTNQAHHGNADGAADAAAAGLHNIESLLRADKGALPAATGAALMSLTRHAQHLAQTCGAHGQAVLHSALMAIVSAAGDRRVTLDVLWDTALADAGAGKVSDAELLTRLQQSARLLAHAQESLTGWQLGAAVSWLVSAQTRIAGQVAKLQSKASIKDAHVRARALVQTQTLSDASGELDMVLTMAAGHQQSQGSEHDIFVGTIVAYVEAMAKADTDPAPLAAPRALQQKLLLRIAAASATESRALAGEINNANGDFLESRGDAIADRAQAAQRDMQYDRQGNPAAASSDALDLLVEAQELKFHVQNQAIAAQLASLADMAADVDSGVASFFGNRFNKTLHETPGELRRLRGVALAFGSYYDQARANIDKRINPTASSTHAQYTAARMAAVAIAAEKFQDFIAGTHLMQVFEQAQDTITRGAARAACSAMILHSTAMLEISVLTGGLASAAGRSVVALGLPELPALVGAVRTASLGWKFAGFVTGLGVEAGLNTAADYVLSGGESSISDSFLSNLAVSVALRPLHGLFARGGKLLDLEKKAATLWSMRGGAMVLKAGVEISLETVAAAAVNYVTMRALHDKARTLSTTTATEWLLQGASLAVGRFIGARSGELEARIAKLEQHVAATKGAAQARAVVRDGSDCKKPEQALARFAEYEARLAHEQELLMREGALAASGQSKLSPAEVNKLAASNAAARTEMQGPVARQAKLRMAGLEADNTAGTLWTVAANDAPAVLARVKAAGFQVTADAGVANAGKSGAAPGAAADAAPPTRWFVEFGGQRVEVRAVDRPSSAPAAGQAPRHFDDVWPGEVPANATPAQVKVFEEANRRYNALKEDQYQGASAGRAAWAEHLWAHGIDVDAQHRTVRSEAQARTVAWERAHVHVAAHDGAVANSSAHGERSRGAAPLTKANCERALHELAQTSTSYTGATVEGATLKVPLPDGKVLKIVVVDPQATPEGAMAAHRREGEAETVWVSDGLTNEQVPEALGRIVAKVAEAHGLRTSADAGGLDAMMGHRKVAGVAVMPTAADGGGGKASEVRARAAEQSKAEWHARMDAEINLRLEQMGLAEAGPAREAKLAALPAGLAAEVRARLAVLDGQHFDPQHVLAAEKVAKPNAVAASKQLASSVLPDAPAADAVRPYGPQDVVVVRDLEVQLTAITELDARMALRDQPGTSGKGSEQIAQGESLRRRGLVTRARELMAQLQLGGDHGYVEARLRELEAVFPGARNVVGPAVRLRIEANAKATRSHAQAEAARAARSEVADRVKATVLATEVFTTDRLISGDGMAALADVATLGVKPAADGWLDPRHVLILGRSDLLARLAGKWGQRAAVFDRAQDAHPAFSDAEGRGDGTLRNRVEDAGEFMETAELRDAMDISRQRHGMAAVDGEVLHVETIKDLAPDAAPWAVDQAKYPVRATVIIDGQARVIYAAHTDITTGSGAPRQLGEGLLAGKDRKTMLADGRMFDGEVMLRGADGDRGNAKAVAGQRVLVVGIGPTGAWAAVEAVKQGAVRVDLASSSGGEKLPGPGEPGSKAHPGKRQVEPQRRTSPEDQYATIENLDRVQDALRSYDDIKVATDRIVRIVPDGKGAKVTYLHGSAEGGELYNVHYDVLVTALGSTNTTAAGRNAAGGGPTVKGVLGDMRMQAQRGTRAPVLEDAGTGRVRVIGIAAGENVNVVMDPKSKAQRQEAEDLKNRRDRNAAKLSADSPNADVMEGVGRATRQSNASDDTEPTQ
ncbi:MAG TPA: hypothetical protein PLF40_01100 [Kofleriaceae bacterium]|nr:hypothetical protein [Kofleriaceae bacterium]